MKSASAMNQPLGVPVPSLDVAPGRHVARRTVVMVVSPGAEHTRAEVVFNLATVCAEIGQRVAVISTAGIETHDTGLESLKMVGPLNEEQIDPRLTEPLRPVDVQDLLEDSNVPGVSLLDLQQFIAHPTQVVIRVPEVLHALRDIVDVVILDVPSFLTVHHGQGLAPLADAVLVVGERRSTTLEQLRRTSAILKRLEAHVIGMAMTTDETDDDDDGWDEEDRAYEARNVRSRRGRSKDGSSHDEPEGAEVTPSDDTTAANAPHRRRRTAVDHAMPLGLGVRSEYPADRDATTLPEA
jgi:Mrp family chromosome partitioning ATPase